MRCYSCTRLTWDILCKACQERLFIASMRTRKLGTLDVISFYPYSNIESLLLSKHKAEGYRIYNALSKMTLKPFIEEFVEADERIVYIIGVDEVIKNGYAHIAVLTRAMKTKTSIPLHAVLMAKNRVTYAGKDLTFRLENPRNFSYKGKKDIDAVLVDDIITTGSTLHEAYTVLRKHGVNVLFALTLADVLES